MSRKLGNIGEDLACEILIKQGYKILDRNFQIRGGEIDIVAKEREVIVFVEVKYRKDEGFGTAAEFITKEKIKNIIKSAKVYLYENNLLDNDWRIDVITIDPESGNFEVINNVYTEGL